MRLRDVVASAYHGVTTNLLRSVLTTLGILIGVAAVIVLVAVGNGSKQAVEDSISSLGTNTLTISGGRSSSQSQSYDLTPAVADDLADHNLTPHVKSISPTVNASSITATAGQQTTTISSVIGTNPAYLTAKDSTIAYGRSFTTQQESSLSKVVVLGETPAEDLFGSARAAVGQRVLLNGTRFTVVGILASQGSNGFSNSDSTAIAPLTTVQASLAGYSTLSSIVAAATSADDVDAAQAEIETVLNNALHVTNTSSLPYSVQNQSDLLAARTESSDTFTVLLGVVAGISLLVGGLGITNIMLVTVTERTREIGVRKALGAQRRSILGQFLLEASMLSIAGGVLGVALGLGISKMTILGVTPVVVPASVTLALGICLVIGVFFGSFPASRASRLRPVEALRHE